MREQSEIGFLQWSRQNKELFRTFIVEAHKLGVEVTNKAVAEMSIRLWESLPESEQDRFRNSSNNHSRIQSPSHEPFIFASSKDGKFAIKTGEESFVDFSVETRHGGIVKQDEISRHQNLINEFWKAVDLRNHQGSLDLSNLETGSPLEACFVLGFMRGRNWPMEAIKKGNSPRRDVMIEVPLLGTSLAVQSLIECERTYYKTQINRLQLQLEETENFDTHNIDNTKHDNAKYDHIKNDNTN